MSVFSSFLTHRMGVMGIDRRGLATALAGAGDPATRQAVDGWVNGEFRPAPSRLPALAGILGCTPQSLALALADIEPPEEAPLPAEAR